MVRFQEFAVVAVLLWRWIHRSTLTFGEMAEDTLYSYIELGASNGPLDCLAATDFLTVDVWTLVGLATHYLLFVIDISSRSV